MANRNNRNNDVDWSEDVNENKMPESEDSGIKGGRTTSDEMGEDPEWDSGLTDDDIEDTV